MKKRFFVSMWILAGVLPALAGIAWAQADFSRYYAIGDSLTAGFSHGSLDTLFQSFSYPALFAKQAGVSDFEQPLVSDPGIPARLTLVHLVPGIVIAPKQGLGHPVNLALPRPYNNLAVPGADVNDVLKTVSDGGLHDVVLRGLGTQLQQFLASGPTFATVWIGNNDVLPAILSGRVIPGVTVTPLATFVDKLQQIFTAIQMQSDVDVVVFNLPDGTKTPFATAIPPVVVDPDTRQPVLDASGNPIPLIGPTGPLPQGSLVLLPASFLMAQGVGIPVALGGNGQPLPDEVVLLPGEIDQIRSTIDSFNKEIETRAADAGFHVFDIHTIFDRMSQFGVPVGGIVVTSDFLIGGLFGYDGIHPTPLGYAILTNFLIDFVVHQFGNDLQPVDLMPFITGAQGSVPPEGQSLVVHAGTGGFRYSPRAVQSLLKVLAPKYLQWLYRKNGPED